MSRLTHLFRPEIRDLQPYRAAQYADGFLRLNANETPWRPDGDDSRDGLNRYPEVRPLTVTRRLAELYGIGADNLLVTRGSSEAIELLIRALCRAGQDDVMICPPTFGMYAVYAHVQGAGVVEVPLLRESGFAVDVQRVLDAWTPRCRILFLCSPNNPTGNSINEADIARLGGELDGRGIVVLDGAYLEFADTDPTTRLLEQFPNIVVLRTLSKALGMAGTRCGALLANPEIVDMAGRILPPYSISTPCEEAVLAALTPAAKATGAEHVATLVAERRRLEAVLAANPAITRVWPSEANFLMVETADAGGLVAAARAGGVLVRDFSWDPWTAGCVRITVGTPEQNDQLLAALS